MMKGDQGQYLEVESLISRLPERHQSALRWFRERRGTESGWPEPLPGTEQTLLATRAKGIYKPAWCEHALSVRQTLDSAFPDLEPENREDGTWSYRYFQENTEPSARDHEFTNRALMLCIRDKVPVGVMIQTKGKPGVKYAILGLAQVVDWQDGYFHLEGASDKGLIRRAGWTAKRVQDAATETAISASEDGLGTTSNRQGRATDPERRKAVELRAMDAAKAFLVNEGYCVADTSSFAPYDLVANKGGRRIYVEVKGTTGRGEEVILTRNEVEHARTHLGECVLFVLHGIEVEETTRGPVGKGGMQRLVRPWDPAGGPLEPISYWFRLPQDPSISEG
jgi:hypothetical protein